MATGCAEGEQRSEEQRREESGHDGAVVRTSAKCARTQRGGRRSLRRLGTREEVLRPRDDDDPRQPRQLELQHPPAQGREPVIPTALVIVRTRRDRKSTRLNSSHPSISHAVFCLKKKKNTNEPSFLANKLIKSSTNAI